jgi:hypothetical protein
MEIDLAQAALDGKTMNGPFFGGRIMSGSSLTIIN